MINNLKYDYLDNLKDALLKEKRKSTADTYYSAANIFFKDTNFVNISSVTNEYVVNKLKGIKTKNEYSKTINALMFLKKLYPEFNLSEEKYLRSLTSSKAKSHREKGEPKDLENIKRKINGVQDKKLRVAYRLGIISGLRVFELAALNKSDIEFTEKGIKIKVRDGKGGESGEVLCLRDKYVEEELKKFTEGKSTSGELFHSSRHMIKEATKIGIECHDLRRAYSKLIYSEKKKEVGAYKANIETQKALRHKKFSTTKRYLNSNIKI